MSVRPGEIVVERASRSFSVRADPGRSLKEALLRRTRGGPPAVPALRDVSFRVAPGETVGIVGRNGAGKTSTLRVLAGIVPVDSGRVEVGGRVVAQLELGAGFGRGFTGRENVFLNAALYGLTKEEVEQRLDAILAFAELGEFADLPVATYSQGMFLRLGFAIAAHLDPDVLLVDEVLAVGDEAFARKCLAKIEEFQRAGKTILFVTHSLDLVTSLCTRGIVVAGGRVQYDGDPAFAVGTLRKILGTDRPVGAPVPQPEIGGHVVRTAVPSATPGGPRSGRFRAGDTMHLRLDVEVQPGPSGHAGDVKVVVMGAGDIPVFSLRTPPGQGLPPVAGRYVVDFVLEVPRLNGAFVVGVQVDEPSTGLPITARRFDDAVWVETGELPGLLDVPAEVAVRAAQEVTR